MSNTSTPTQNSAISVRDTTATSKWLGATSPKSGKQIAVGDKVVLCPKCYAPQLLQDWHDNGDKCAIDETPARVIERAARAAGEGAAPPAAAPAAPAAAAAAPAVRAATPAAAPAAAAAVMASSGPAAANVMVDPYRYARPVDATPVSDVWRRNIMTIFWLLIIWGFFVGVVWLLRLGPVGIAG
jgi:hypothetical protein